MYFDDLTQEQQERIRSCETPDEILDVAKEYGMEFSEEQFDAVSGGDQNELWCSTNVCNYYDIAECGRVG